MAAIFFQTDRESRGYLTYSQLEGLLTFILMDTPSSQLKDIITEFDDDKSGVVSQVTKSRSSSNQAMVACKA